MGELGSVMPKMQRHRAHVNMLRGTTQIESSHLSLSTCAATEKHADVLTGRVCSCWTTRPPLHQQTSHVPRDSIEKTDVGSTICGALALDLGRGAAQPPNPFASAHKKKTREEDLEFCVG